MLFFIKALPLSKVMPIETMSQPDELPKVFNTYNLNILFTIAALPCKVSLMAPPDFSALPSTGPIKSLNPDEDGSSDNDNENEENKAAFNH
jgi:hypothetical protein